MKEKVKDYDVGVIVGRFQVPELHQAHIDLIQHVCEIHDKVVIFLGLSPLMVTKENPLDFESRKQMILEKFPHVNVLYIKDVNNDERWSKRLDDQIGDLTTPRQSAVLYGSRDSFIRHYTGKYPTVELESDVIISGSEVRKQVSRRSVRSSPDFRAGVVWAAFGKFPTCYPTVDVVIFNEDHTRVLLGKKADEDRYRIIGGFADPNSDSYEADARREVMEEAGIEIGDLKYIGSTRINDWRYRGEEDCIKTLLFTAKYTFGSPKAGDDIAEVRWFDTDKLTEQDVMPNHQYLMHLALASVKKLQVKYTKD